MELVLKNMSLVNSIFYLDRLWPLWLVLLARSLLAHPGVVLECPCWGCRLLARFWSRFWGIHMLHLREVLMGWLGSTCSGCMSRASGDQRGARNRTASWMKIYPLLLELRMPLPKHSILIWAFKFSCLLKLCRGRGYGPKHKLTFFS